MIKRDEIKCEIDQLQEEYLDFLQRIIRSLTPGVPKTPEPTQESKPNESWEEFIQNMYGTFQDDPLERSPQGTVEIREALE